MHHYRKTIQSYNQLRKKDEAHATCPFCKDTMESVAVDETLHSYVIPNRTKYDLWEGHSVETHYLVIPKRHVSSLGELSESEMLDTMRLIAKYEALEFNVYARGVNSPRRSVTHQHTHLIKFASRKQARVSLFIERPYILLSLKNKK